MKKKVISALLVTTMVASMAVGCGDKADSADSTPAADDAATDDAATDDAADDTADDAADDVAAADEGKVLNIQVWNEEFKTRVTDHYPDYEEVDGTTGKIGDVTVKWTITPSDDNAYQNHLDEVLLQQADAAADDKVDMFLIEADYALKYVDTEYTMNVADLGITEDDLANQYQYTRDVVTDANGVQKGISWQGCPCVLIYNREIAKEVLGSDEPADVQAAVNDMDTFYATADKMKDAGYYMTSSPMDLYNLYAKNVSSKWVEDGKIQIDPNIKQWAEDAKKLVDKGECTGIYDLWSDDWSKGFYPEGNVFCYLGPAWFIDFSMAADTEGSIANAGGWGATEGPMSFYWGGTWICGATGTDNPTLVADIMKTICCDTDTMLEIVKADNDFVNDKPAMTKMAADTSYSNTVLGGQNPLAMFCAGAENTSLKYMSAYDTGLNESFEKYMKNYFSGNQTYEEAEADFLANAVTLYPDLSY